MKDMCRDVIKPRRDSRERISKYDYKSLSPSRRYIMLNCSFRTSLNAVVMSIRLHEYTHNMILIDICSSTTRKLYDQSYFMSIRYASQHQYNITKNTIASTVRNKTTREVGKKKEIIE